MFIEDEEGHGRDEEREPKRGFGHERLRSGLEISDTIGEGKGRLRSAYNTSNKRREKGGDEENVSRCRMRARDVSWRSEDSDGWSVRRQRQQ